MLLYIVLHVSASDSNKYYYYYYYYYIGCLKSDKMHML